MDQLSHDSSYATKGSSPVLGNNRSQSDRAAYDFNWAANRPPETLSQHSAPQTQVRQGGNFDVFSFPDPGSPMCISPFLLQQPTSGTPSHQGFGRDHLDSPNYNSQDIHGRTYVPSNYPVILPTTNISDARFQQIVNPINSHTLSSEHGYQKPGMPSNTADLQGTGSQLPSEDFRHLGAHQQTSACHGSTITFVTGKRPYDVSTLVDAESVEEIHQPSKLKRIAEARLEQQVMNGPRTQTWTALNECKSQQKNKTPTEVVDSTIRKNPDSPPYSPSTIVAPHTLSTRLIHDSPRHRGKILPNQLSSSQIEALKLTDKQKKFIRQWHGSFSQDDNYPSIADETINALATLMRAPPQPIFEYVNRKFVNTNKDPTLPTYQASSLHPFSAREQTKAVITNYSLTEANQHLPATTLHLVEKYVLSCQRRRTQSDGRRSVNEGPFRCSFSCGYQTKRAFDWRRHEETHEPQELWLCVLCRQLNERNPFLVNRKDKFLKHAKDSHKDWMPDTALEMSKVDFRPNFNPQCPHCPERSDSWDERCRHILTHYEDDLHRQLKGRIKKSDEESISDGDSSKAGSHAGSKDLTNEDIEQDNPKEGLNQKNSSASFGN